jgi:hypothetical protein
MSPRHDDMQKVRAAMMRLAFQNRDNPALMRDLPYVALYAAGFRDLEDLPPAVVETARGVGRLVGL